MPRTPEEPEEQAAFQLRIPVSQREALDRLIGKLKGKGVLHTKASRNDWISELIAASLDAPAAEHERIASRIADRHS